MKLAIAAPGRFHAFDLARALLERGHDVTVFTNYPRWAAARFDLPRRHVQSLWLHGVVARAVLKYRPLAPRLYPEAWLHEMFGQWVAQRIQQRRWDVVHLFSGIAEEGLRALAREPTLRLMVRGSAHIRTQARLLQEEEQRTSSPQDRPSQWMIAREEREYQLADRVLVLSSFAYRSFLAEGVSSSRLALLPLGARLEHFRPSGDQVEARARRILSGEPLRVLYVGTLSFQKGLWDMAQVARALGGERFLFQLVGPRTRESRGIVDELVRCATLTPKKPQAELPQAYRWADIFLFPTIQDGYAQVLVQAAASALPILTTMNCAGPDLIREGENGWVVPIRRPDLLVERLRWCDARRTDLATMVRRVYEGYRPRDWAEVAADFESLCEGLTMRQHVPRELPV